MPLPPRAVAPAPVDAPVDPAPVDPASVDHGPDDRGGLRGRRTALRPLAVVLGLAVVTTAGAPGLIRVRSGDTLSELAQRHGTSVSALRSANGLAGDRIYAGRTLRLPGTGSGAGTTAYRHVVRPGENASVIARRAGVSVSSLLRRNGLTSRSLLRPGQRLAIPTRTSAGGGVRAGLGSTDRAAARQMVAATARRLGVSALALAVAYQESGFQQRVVSSVGAVGIMQVLPSTGRQLSRQVGRRLDLRDPQDNVTAGVLLLRELKRTRGSDAATVAAYYQGIGSIARKGILPQTRTYIRNTLALRDGFAGR